MRRFEPPRIPPVIGSVKITQIKKRGRAYWLALAIGALLVVSACTLMMNGYRWTGVCVAYGILFLCWFYPHLVRKRCERETLG